MIETWTVEEEIRGFLQAGKTSQAMELLEDKRPEDIALIIDGLEDLSILQILEFIPEDQAFEVFEKFSHHRQASLADIMPKESFYPLFNQLSFDDKIDLLDELDEDKKERVIENSPYAERKLIRKFLAYPTDSAGSIMTIEFLVLDADMTVSQALDHIKVVGMTKETIYTCYVTDEAGRLVGILSLRDLVTSNFDDKIADIMEREIISVNIDDDQEEVAENFLKYDYLSQPVVDKQMRLQGIITVDDIMEVLEEETTEDFEKMAAISPSEKGYLGTPVSSLARNRLTWLLIFMVTSTFTAAIISNYESMLAKVTVLSVYIPMIMSTGGNAGNQASATVIRGMATGEIKLTDWFRIIIKEASIAIISAAVMAVINLVKLILVDRVGFEIALTVSLTLVLTVILAKLVGGTLPVLAERLGLDPAIMAGPLITTIVDAGSLLIYLQFASAILGI